MGELSVEIELAREQLARAGRALEAIRRDILPVSEARYKISAYALFRSSAAIRERFFRSRL